MWVVTIEAGIVRELGAGGEQMLPHVDLGELGRSCLEVPVAQLAQFPTPTNRHFGHELAFFEIDVGRDRSMTQLALHGCVLPGAEILVFGIVARRACFVAAVANRLVTVLGDGRTSVLTELAPGLGDEQRSAEDHRDHDREEQDGCAEDVLRVNQRAIRVHGAGPPWWMLGLRGARELRS
jgi:hypothetical protein